MDNNIRPTFLDHIVILVKDIKRTAEFYNKILGEPILQDDDQVVYQIDEIKIFFSLSNDYVWHDKDKYGLNHLAFGVRSLEELKGFEKVLEDNEIKNSGIGMYKHADKESIWFDDPDGYRIEFYLRELAQRL